ncbi:translocation protein SEC62 isoform X1 [Notamacropus eugenii]
MEALARRQELMQKQNLARMEMEMGAIFQPREIGKSQHKGLMGLGLEASFLYQHSIPINPVALRGRSRFPEVHLPNDLYVHRSSLDDLHDNTRLMTTGPYPPVSNWQKEKGRRLGRRMGNQKASGCNARSSKSQEEDRNSDQTLTISAAEKEEKKDLDIEPHPKYEPTQSDGEPTIMSNKSLKDHEHSPPKPCEDHGWSIETNDSSGGNVKDSCHSSTVLDDKYLFHSPVSLPPLPYRFPVLNNSSLLPPGTSDLFINSEDLPSVEDIRKWAVDDVYDFITGLPGCADYAQIFRDHAIDGETLPLLTEEHLLDTLGLKLGPALKIRSQEVGEPSKEEKAVAKYLRFNCPTKSTNMMGHRVDYFIASKAVDCLLDSKWAKAKKGEEALFTTRESVVDYCNRLLKKQFFHRALKVMKVKPDKDTKKEKEKEKGKVESGKEEEKRNKKENLKDEKAKKEREKKKDGEKEESKKEETPGTPKKKETKKKFKLEPHEDQVFLDGNEVYVWIYDPVHFKTFAMGLILVIAVIAATLFPLWPAEMRVGVYYLSVGAGCFVASILLLAIARCILFLIIWLITGGRHHFWFLPNLTADVGFIDSFRPLYTHEYKGPKADLKKDEKSEAKKQQKSDSEEKSDSEKKEDDDGKIGTLGNNGAEGSVGERHSDTDSDRREDDRSQHSSGNGNDFEMITKEELEQQTDGDCEEDDEGEEDEEETARPSSEKS